MLEQLPGQASLKRLPLSLLLLRLPRRIAEKQRNDLQKQGISLHNIRGPAPGAFFHQFFHQRPDIVCIFPIQAHHRRVFRQDSHRDLQAVPIGDVGSRSIVKRTAEQLQRLPPLRFKLIDMVRVKPAEAPFSKLQLHAIYVEGSVAGGHIKEQRPARKNGWGLLCDHSFFRFKSIIHTGPPLFHFIVIPEWSFPLCKCFSTFYTYHFT